MDSIPLEPLTLVVGTVSITLAIVSILVAGYSMWQSSKNFEKTSDTLNKINERSAGTEAIVGEHFSKMMDTMLDIVDTASKTPEIQVAELEAEESKRRARLQDQIMPSLVKAVDKGEQLKVGSFKSIMEELKRSLG